MQKKFLTFKRVSTEKILILYILITKSVIDRIKVSSTVDEEFHEFLSDTVSVERKVKVAPRIPDNVRDRVCLKLSFDPPT